VVLPERAEGAVYWNSRDGSEQGRRFAAIADTIGSHPSARRVARPCRSAPARDSLRGRTLELARKAANRGEKLSRAGRAPT